MKINVLAPVNPLGYGVAGLNIVKGLWEEGVEVSLFPIGQPQVSSQEDHAVVAKSLSVAERFDPNAPSLRIWHQNALAEHVGRGLHIGFPIFELDTFTPLEKHHLESCDRLFVCSDWAKQVVLDQIKFHDPKLPFPRSHTEPSVHVVPLGVDSTIFKPTNPTKKDKTVFFNCGKWEVRKGHDVLIEAFKRAYSQNPKIELWMMCSNPFNSPQEEKSWEDIYNHPGVKLIPRAETQKEVYNIMAQADCGVFPSRGEGWNLELLEMMSIGRDVIATNYSAHTEFCTSSNSRLVDVAGLELAYDNKWFFGQGKWAKLNENTINDLSLAMLDFAESHNLSISEPGIKTAEKFSWRNTAREIVKGINK